MEHRAFVEPSWIDERLLSKDIPLPHEAMHRFSKVLRLKEGTFVRVFDGQDRELLGALGFLAGGDGVLKEAVLSIEKCPHPPIVWVQAALELSKLEETIAKGCEFGVCTFVIFKAQRCLPHVFEKAQNKLERLNKIAQDAARQSGRFQVPKIHMIDAFSKLEATLKGHRGIVVFGEIAHSHLLSQILKEKEAFARDGILMVIGPEGDLTKEEQQTLRQLKAHGVCWSPYVLRSELAGLMAVAIYLAHMEKA